MGFNVARFFVHALDKQYSQCLVIQPLIPPSSPQNVLMNGTPSLEEALRINCRYPDCFHFEYNEENMGRHYEWKHKKQMAEERWRAMKEAGAFEDLEVPKLGLEVAGDVVDEGNYF